MKVYVLKITDDEKEVTIHLFRKFENAIERVIKIQKEYDDSTEELLAEIRESLEETNAWVDELSEIEYEIVEKEFED